jgi:leader peptidase (prepilin peptidase)/N-methyltransferase
MSEIFQLLQSSPLVFTCACAAFGLMIGSFLNVVIYRLPKMMEREWHAQCAELNAQAAEDPLPGGGVSLAGAAEGAPRYNLVVPRSACPHCGHMISALENIPIISYLLLRGKCKGCGAPISARYPIVELVSGLLSGYAAWHFGFGLATLGALLFVWALLALTFIDFDTQLLPDDITFPLLWIGLLLNLSHTFTDLHSSVVGAVAGYLALWGVYWLFKLATGKEGMGYGDFKLLSAIGAWLGWQMLPLVILTSSLVGAVVGITLIVAARHGRNVPIPFGPYLAGGGLIALFWGQTLTQSYLQMMSTP